MSVCPSFSPPWAFVIPPPLFALLVKSEFIYETAPFRSCHASTIAETKAGLVAAWFGGTGEGHRDVGIWVSRHENGRWTAPAEVADGVVSPTNRYPTWNPVLFQPKTGPLLLFYKVGPSPSTWWGMLLHIRWTTAKRGARRAGCPRAFSDRSKTNPCNSRTATSFHRQSTEHEGWRVHFERRTDGGSTWTATTRRERWQNESAPSSRASCFSTRTANCRRLAGRRKEKSLRFGPTIRAARGAPWRSGPAESEFRHRRRNLADGRHLLVYNHNTASKSRSPLNVALSDGRPVVARGADAGR